jgi:hypothetical protein
MTDKTIMLNLSSKDRNKSIYANSSDCAISFDDVSSVKSISIHSIELPHSRYTIDTDNNIFYFSELHGTNRYFYKITTSRGAYSVSDLVTALTLSASSAVCMNGDVACKNTYAASVNTSFGRVAFGSTGTVPFNVHCASTAVQLSSISIVSSTTANIVFFYSSAKVFAQGALLTLNLNSYANRTVQVTSVTADYTVQVTGDFTGINVNNLGTITLSTMTPFSGANGMADVLGFGETDLSEGSQTPIISVQSPFASGTTDSVGCVVTTDLPSFVAKLGYVKLSGISGFLNDQTLQVSKVYDDTHFVVAITKSILLSATSGGAVQLVSDTSVLRIISSATISNVDYNLVTVSIVTTTNSSFQVGNVVSFTGMDSSEWDSIELTVTSITNSVTFVATFTYPMSKLFTENDSKVTMISNTTSNPTLYISPSRFDFSKDKRTILVEVKHNNADLGNIIVSGLSGKRFFGRLQMFSGLDSINFLDSKAAAATHVFPSTVNKLSSLRFTFYNMDGTEYDFSKTDWSVLLQVTVAGANVSGTQLNRPFLKHN